jgi:hypothetical protein
VLFAYWLKKCDTKVSSFEYFVSVLYLELFVDFAFFLKSKNIPKCVVKQGIYVLGDKIGFTTILDEWQ